jgi:nitrite reductase (NADH) large subunit
VHYEREGVARLIRLHRGRIVGALGVGAWDGFTDVQEATIRQRRVWPWQAVRFARTGRLWHSDPESAAAAWGPASVICQCMNVTRGQIGAACAGAPITVDRIMMRTGASTLCGSCRPLLEQLAQPGSWERPPIARGLLAGSFAAIIAAVAIVAVAPVPFATSFETPFRIDALWRNGLYRQISGFTLLGLALVASLLAVRKRWPRLATLGSFRGWRLVHVLLGVLTLAALAVHTGLRLGNNLNFALMAIFCAVNLAGGLAGGLTAVEQRIGMAHWRRRRALLVTVHVLLMWPLPLLIAFHVMAVYYF